MKPRFPVWLAGLFFCLQDGLAFPVPDYASWALNQGLDGNPFNILQPITFFVRPSPGTPMELPECRGGRVEMMGDHFICCHPTDITTCRRISTQRFPHLRKKNEVCKCPSTNLPRPEPEPPRPKPQIPYPEPPRPKPQIPYPEPPRPKPQIPHPEPPHLPHPEPPQIPHPEPPHLPHPEPPQIPHPEPPHLPHPEPPHLPHPEPPHPEPPHPKSHLPHPEPNPPRPEPQLPHPSGGVPSLPRDSLQGSPPPLPGSSNGPSLSNPTGNQNIIDTSRGQSTAGHGHETPRGTNPDGHTVTTRLERTSSSHQPSVDVPAGQGNTPTCNCARNTANTHADAGQCPGGRIISCENVTYCCTGEGKNSECVPIA